MIQRLLERADLDVLMTLISDEGFGLLGPTIRDNAIVYDRIESTGDLPEGWADSQDGGHYRLRRRDDSALFGFGVGPTSWKRYLFPPESELLRVRRHNGDLLFEACEHPSPGYAFIGVRACEIAAIAIQDRVFLGQQADPTYAANRRGLFVVAVNCGQAGGTCFCSSMGTGPECDSGYDIALTELMRQDPPEYLATSGSSRGEAMLMRIDAPEPSPADIEEHRSIMASTEAAMGRSMETEGIEDLLIGNPNHTRWEQVAGRCLTCGNCTLACPTCFCSTTVDSVTLDGEALRSRKWDSCFSLEFTGLHGHPVRDSAKSRYRQWMTHKLATWHHQFGTSGCVGCGRCITWCPVGIDITEEVAAMRETVPL